MSENVLQIANYERAGVRMADTTTKARERARRVDSFTDDGVTDDLEARIKNLEYKRASSSVSVEKFGGVLGLVVGLIGILIGTGGLLTALWVYFDQRNSYLEDQLLQSQILSAVLEEMSAQNSASEERLRNLIKDELARERNANELAFEKLKAGIVKDLEQ